MISNYLNIVRIRRIFKTPRKAPNKTGAVYMFICSFIVSHVMPFSPMSAKQVWKTYLKKIYRWIIIREAQAKLWKTFITKLEVTWWTHASTSSQQREENLGGKNLLFLYIKHKYAKSTKRYEIDLWY